MLEMIETKRRCIGLNKAGDSCNAPPLLDSDYCLYHEPSLEEFRAENRKHGGRQKLYLNVSGEKVKIENADSVMGLIEEVIANLRTMDLTVNQSRALLAAAETAMKALEYKELTDRVKKLEETIENRRSE